MWVKIIILSYWIIILYLWSRWLRISFGVCSLVDLLTMCVSLTWGNCALGLTTYVMVMFFLPILRRLRLSSLVRPFNGLWLFVICNNIGFGYSLCIICFYLSYLDYLMHVLTCCDVAFMYVFTVPCGCSWWCCLWWYYLICLFLGFLRVYILCVVVGVGWWEVGAVVSGGRGLSVCMFLLVYQIWGYACLWMCHSSVDLFLSRHIYGIFLMC
jgi:hypothetical protein